MSIISPQKEDNAVKKNDYSSQLNWIINEISQVSDKINTDDRGVVLSQQDQVKTILKQEKVRLLEKKKSIDLATESQNRLITLNENYNKRMLEYIKMIIVIALSLAIIAIMVGFSVASNIVIIVSIIILSFSSIYCFATYVRMQGRDNIYFDEMKLTDLEEVITNTGTVTGASGKSTVNSSSYFKCYGSDCCSKGTSWDASTELCIPSKTIERMTLHDNEKNIIKKKKHCGLCNKKKSNDHSVPYQPSEFDLYAKI